jgi:hypothetical protein
MQTLLHRSLFSGWHTAGLIAMLYAAGIHAASSCPDVVISPAGSTFNVAALVADNGSPEAALGKARMALAQVDSGAGCHRFKDVAACNETIALAKQVIATLEACTATPRQKHSSVQ